ncbi:hypothetical protein FDECE_7521 [Fusarium decemcellulare]|nr:hypothetical protein FDECE_7521 [Fusarium decemcellulare]
MFFTRDVASFALAALLFCGSSSGAPSNYDQPLFTRQDDTDPGANATAVDETPTSLEPIVPPAVDPDDLSILALDTQVTLAWAGTPSDTTTTRRMLKRDEGIFSQANFTFIYPTIPLDHSTFVTDITCSGDSLTATLSSRAYSFAKKQWKGAGKIIFVTAVDGCGEDNANDLFLAKSITFDDAAKTFTAKGADAEYSEIMKNFNLKWGEIGTLNFRRAIDKRAMFEPHPIHRRKTADFSVTWDATFLNLMGLDASAPWKNSALLYKFPKDGGQADNSWTKGTPAKTPSKRSAELEERGGPDYGLALYCVECGFSGSARIHGEIAASKTWSWPFIKVETVQTGFYANFDVDINLGLQAYVKYSQGWEKELSRIPLSGFNIPLLVDIGPFVSVSIAASTGIKATGKLLIGTEVQWNDVDVFIDLLDSSNTYANNMVPRFNPQAQASGELKMSASVEMPVKLGVQINIMKGKWKADAAVKDTPSVISEGAFKVSAGTDGTDINDNCYGIDWDIHFENALQAVVEVTGVDPVTVNLIDPQISDPIAEGCIGYKKPACTPTVIDLPQVPGLFCKKIVNQANVPSTFALGKPTTASTALACGTTCLKNKQCLSFTYNSSKKCQLYKKAVKSLGTTTKKGNPGQAFYDKQCYSYTGC